MLLAFGLSPSPMEIMVIAVIALIVLGPSRLPEAARSLGRGLKEMRDSFQGKDDDPQLDAYDDEDDDDDDDEDDVDLAGDGVDYEVDFDDEDVDDGRTTRKRAVDGEPSADREPAAGRERETSTSGT